MFALNVPESPWLWRLMISRALCLAELFLTTLHFKPTVCLVYVGVDYHLLERILPSAKSVATSPALAWGECEESTCVHCNLREKLHCALGSNVHCTYHSLSKSMGVLGLSSLNYILQDLNQLLNSLTFVHQSQDRGSVWSVLYRSWNSLLCWGLVACLILFLCLKAISTGKSRFWKWEAPSTEFLSS